MKFKNLSAEITRAGLTQSEFAERIGISVSSLRLKMKGKVTFSLEETIRINNSLGGNHKLEYLFEEAFN